MKASADLAGSGCIEALVDTKIQPSSITAILAGFESLGWKRQRRLGRKQDRGCDGGGRGCILSVEKD